MGKWVETDEDRQWFEEQKKFIYGLKPGDLITIRGVPKIVVETPEDLHYVVCEDGKHELLFSDDVEVVERRS